MKSFNGRIVLVICLVPFLILALISLAQGQSISGEFKVERDDADILLNKLRNDQSLDEIPEYFYGNAYNKWLADLVIFVDKDRLKNGLEDAVSDHARAALVYNAKKRKDLFGQVYLFCLVFVATDSQVAAGLNKTDTSYTTTERKVQRSAKDKSKTGTAEISSDTIWTQKEKLKHPVNVSLSPLEYKMGSGEFILYRLTQGIATKFLGISTDEEEKKKAAADTTISLKLEHVGYSQKDSIHLYYSYVKFPLRENTINRMGLTGPRKSLIYNTFGNYSDSRVSPGLGVLVTWFEGEPNFADSLDKTIYDPFVFAQMHIKRPCKPARHSNDKIERYLSRISLDLVIGTRIDKITEIFDDNFVGLGLGHLVGSIGIVTGYNFRLLKDGKTKRKGYFAVGLNMAL